MTQSDLHSWPVVCYRPRVVGVCCWWWWPGCPLACLSPTGFISIDVREAAGAGGRAASGASKSDGWPSAGRQAARQGLLACLARDNYNARHSRAKHRHGSHTHARPAEPGTQAKQAPAQGSCTRPFFNAISAL